MGRAKRLRVENLPYKLKQIRDSLGLSQNELIKELGFENDIYQGNISEYESGKREPPLPILLRYAQLAGVCLDTLVDDKDVLPKRLPNIHNTNSG
jgi:transcriptional regulator with XRE-family HTH domain